MKLKVVKLADLVFDKKNSVSHNTKNIEAIKASIQKFGQYRAFVVQAITNKVIVGNGMLKAMLELGLTEGFADIRQLSDKEARLLGATDNKTSELHEWDLVNLKDMIRENGSQEILDLGWESFELDALLGVDNQNSPNFDSSPSLSDINIESEINNERNKRNLGTLKFNSEDWAIIRDAVVEIRLESPEYSEADAIVLICKRYLEASRGES